MKAKAMKKALSYLSEEVKRMFCVNSLEKLAWVIFWRGNMTREIIITGDLGFIVDMNQSQKETWISQILNSVMRVMSQVQKGLNWGRNLNLSLDVGNWFSILLRCEIVFMHSVLRYLNKNQSLIIFR